MKESCSNADRDHRGLLTPGPPTPPGVSMVFSFAALRAFTSRVLLRSTIGSIGVGTTTTLLAARASLRTVAACTRFAGVALLALRLPGSEPAACMQTCSSPARATVLRLTVLLVGLLTCQAIRTPSTPRLIAPTHYTRSSPCVLETP